MDVQIKLNDVDISSYVLSYTRDKSICDGVGIADVELNSLFPTTVVPYDEIKIYESSVHKGTYFVSSQSKTIPAGSLTLNCQDSSKLLADYFISDQYDIGDDLEVRASDIIKKYLDEVGVSYSFTTYVGDSYVAKYSVFGLTYANEVVTAMCQQCGWFFKFDADNTCIFGSFALGTGAASIDAGDMTSVNNQKDDAMARNMVKVWGADDLQYTVDESGVWQRDSNDDRAIVLSNGWIDTEALAQTLSTQLLTEYNKITDKYEIELIGAYNLDIGDTLTYSSSYFSGDGIITALEAIMSKDGLLTRVTLGQRCPRQYAYYGCLLYTSPSPRDRS